MKQLRHWIRNSRSSTRLFELVVVAALAVAATAIPARVAAQAPAADTASAPAAPTAQSANAPKPDADQTEEEEDNVYRHAPVVHSLAKVLHLKVETTARIFEAINFAIIALVILIPLGKFFPKVLRKRSQTLRHDIEEARKVTEDANTRLSAVEAKLSELDQEIARMRTHVEEEMKQDEVRIKATIEEESARIVSTAEQEITVAAAHAKRSLRHYAVDLAIEQASNQLVLTPETDRRLVAEFVRDVAKGGEN